MTLNFKIAQLKDLDLLTDISRITFIDAFEKDNKPDDFQTYINSAFSKDTLRKELLNTNSSFYFVYQNNELVGYYKLNENEAQNEQFNTYSIELERIYVYKMFQGKNIGAQILNNIIEYAKQKETLFLWLGVWDQNKSAIRFYKQHGFVIFDSHPYYIGNDKQTDLLMKLALNN